jgi:hypothetical protein
MVFLLGQILHPSRFTVNLLGNLKSLVRVLTRSVQMPTPEFVLAFFVMLRRRPVSLGGKVMVFSGLSVQALNAIA